jgi:hypothetical protein
MTRTKLPRGAKTAFIKAHAKLSAKEVVELAAKEGIKLTPAAVYNFRSVANKSKGNGRAASSTKAKGTRRSTGSGNNLMSVVEFVRVQGGIKQARQAILTLESLQLS